MRDQKITLGEMRSSGVRGLLVYCADYKCARAVRISADRWPDDIRLSDLEAAVRLSQACGRRGAAGLGLGAIATAREWSSGFRASQCRGHSLTLRTSPGRSISAFRVIVS